MEHNLISYKNHKRKIFGPTTEIMGFIFMHSFGEMCKDDTNPDKRYCVDLSLCFYWLGGKIVLHNNRDTPEKSLNTYVNKINLLGRLALKAYNHLQEGKGPLLIRRFLNNPKVNDGFSASIYIHVDPDDKDNWCVFEISSCFKKHRYLVDVKGMKVYLKNLLSFIAVVKEDLSVIKGKF